MNAYRALLKALWRSQRRDPVGLFFSSVRAGLVLAECDPGNDPRPEFGGRDSSMRPCRLRLSCSHDRGPPGARGDADPS